MWIDALCINQADTAEKGPQVVMMGDIFRLAQRVVAWLGPEENDSNHAMFLIRYLGLQLEVDYITATMSAVDGCADPKLADRRTPLPYSVRDLRAIYHLVSRPWFEKLWVRQEILLANSDAVVACGLRQLEWHVFRRALFCINMKPRWTFDLSMELDTRLNTTLAFVQDYGRSSILNLRQLYQSCQCLNPLDRLYAVLALLPESQRAFISPPDYTISYVDLYSNVTRRYINYYETLEILGRCDSRDDGPCPSWVPDWSNSSSLPHTAIASTCTRASSQLRCWYEFPQPEVLGIMGISISEVEHYYHGPDWTAMTEKVQFDGMRALFKEFGQGRQFSSEILARIIFGYTLSDDRDPPVEHRPKLNDVHWVLNLLLSDDQYNNDDFGWTTVNWEILARAASDLRGLQLIRTKHGHLGLAPGSGRVGDGVCCAFGCSELLLLRPLGDSTLKLVGPCLVPEFSNGEAILGPPPDNFQAVRTHNKVTGLYEFGFKDVFSGETTYEDPRLKALPLDPNELHSFRKRLDKRHLARIYIDPEILQKSGVKLRRCDLA